MAVRERERRRTGDASDLRVTLFDGERANRLEGLADIPSRIGASSLLWIDAGKPSEDEARHIVDALDLDDDALEVVSGGGRTTRFHDGGDFVAVTLEAPEAATVDSVVEVGCLVGKRWVVTSHAKPIDVLDEFTELAEGSGPTGELDGPSFLATLVAWVLKAYDTAFDHLEEELEVLDEDAMRGRGAPDAHIESLVELRRRAGKLRRALSTHRAALLALTHPELEALADEVSAQRFHELLSSYDMTMQTARDTRTSIVSSFDVVIARTGQRTNDVMKILTLASVILLPGSLLAGIMGMNFKAPVFAHPAMFWVVLAVIALIAVVTLAVARVRSWI
jgi:Mg2+ and Co2+ transporter CorA